MIRGILASHAPFPAALDFGSGDGWFARQMLDEKLASEVVAVDVRRRRRAFVEPLVYDGERLPFPDRAFDLAYSIDVLHHCPDPRRSLRELLRCTGSCLLLKDHTYGGGAGWLALSIMDEIGNRRFGVPSRYRYQRDWEWNAVIEEAGFMLDRLVHPAACHVGLLGRATNHLQYLALWRRGGE